MDFNRSDISVPPESSNEPVEFEWTWVLVVFTIIFTLIILFTVLGNALVLAAVILDKTLRRSPTCIFIGNLALADFLVGILVLPCNATVQITLQWYFGLTYCILWHCIHLWLCSASILSVCAICFDRYIGVSYPLKHFKLMHGRVVRGIIASVWILAFCLGVIPVFVWPEPQNPDGSTCNINIQFGLVMVVSFGIFYIPTIVMIFFYVKIFMVAKRHQASLRKSEDNTSSSLDSNSTLRIHVGRSQTSLNQLKENNGSSCASTRNLFNLNFSRQTKAAKQLTVIVAAFVLCYCPFFTVFLIECLQPELVSQAVFDTFGWLRYTNSAFNPVLYAAMLPAFRKAFYKILTCNCNKK